MKKIALFLVALSLMFLTTGCNVYVATHEGDNIYYGAYNRRDMIHADVKMYKKGTDKVCDGSIYLNAPSRSITFKNDCVDAKMILGCNDGTLIDMNWDLRKGSFTDGSGEGVDQLGNVYKFRTISKNEWKRISEVKKIKFINDKKESYLKY